jgi:DNA-binding CsgD family transcriptional regulator
MPSDGPEAAPVLSDGLVTLRAVTSADIPDLMVAASDPRILRWADWPHPFTRAAAEQVVSPEAGATEAVWALAILPNDRWSGMVELRPDGTGGSTVRLTLAPWAGGSANGARALRLACAWGFSAWGLQVCTWSAYAGDDDVLHSARLTGFQVPSHVFRAFGVQRGHRRDCWLGTLTPEDLRAAARLAESRRDYLGPELTRRELDVLRHLAQGASNRSIAVELGISENTVKNHVRSILEKLQVSSRSEAVVSALRLGFVSLPS